MATYTLSNIEGAITLGKQSILQSGSESIWDFLPMPPLEYKPRLGLVPRFGKDGEVVTADERIGARKMTVKINSTANAANESSLISDFNFLVGFFQPSRGPFYITHVERSIRAQCRLERFDSKTTEELLWRSHQGGIIELQLVDGLWEDEIEQTTMSDTGGLANGGTMSVVNSGEFEAFPIITVQPLLDIQEFTITNDATGVFSNVQDASMTAGSAIVINSVEAPHLLINGVSAPSALTDGSGLIRFSSGSNTLQYASGDGPSVVSVSWRRRYYA